MTWTYTNNPATTNAATRRDAVRLLTGDTDSTDQQQSDEEIAFYLSEAGDDVYRAAVSACRALAGRYSRRVDVSFEGVKSSYSQMAQHYHSLAIRLEREAAKNGSAGLGTPLFGGVSKDEVRDVEDDDDRVGSAFRVGQFRNPTRWTNDDLGD